MEHENTLCKKTSRVKINAEKSTENDCSFLEDFIGENQVEYFTRTSAVCRKNVREAKILYFSAGYQSERIYFSRQKSWRTSSLWKIYKMPSKCQPKIVPAKAVVDEKTIQLLDGNDMTTKVYKIRWLILLLFMFYVALTTFQFVQYSIITNIVTRYCRYSFSRKMQYTVESLIQKNEKYVFLPIGEVCQIFLALFKSNNTGY